MSVVGNVVACLICVNRQAEGTLRRVYVDDGQQVINDPDVPQAKVCLKCAREHNSVIAKAAFGRTTVWEFEIDPDIGTERRLR